MKTTKERRVVSDHHFNSFHQFVTEIDELEFVTHQGTFDEMIEASFVGRGVYTARCAATEHLFPKWDNESRFVVMCNGEPDEYARYARDIHGAGWYFPCFEIEE